MSVKRIQGEIAQAQADIIVNAANGCGWMGGKRCQSELHQGVSEHINYYTKGAVEKEALISARKYPHISSWICGYKAGDFFTTSSGGLTCKQIIHAVSPYDRNTEYHINPLDVYITAYDDTNISEKITITDTIDKTFCLMEGIICRNLTNAEKSVIADKVKELFIPFVKYLIDNRLQYDYEHNPTLSDIAELLLSEKDTELTVNLHEQEVVIKEYFSYKTHMPDDRAVVLSWEDTPHFLNSALYAGGVMYSWNRLLQNREKRKYTWIYLEEMDSLLSNKTESTLSIVYELFKRSRPYGGIVTLIAQSVEELKKSEIGNACLVSAGFIRCLSCKCQDRNSISKVFGLHDDILEYINSAPAGTGLLIAPEHVIPFDIKQQV